MSHAVDDRPPREPAQPRRKALLASAGVAALFAGASFYRRWTAGDRLEAGITVHEQPQAMPALAFNNEQGRRTGLADFSGRIVLLNIWATWCGLCREEMPTLDRLQAALGGPAFEVIALSVDSGGLAVVQTFFKQIGIRHLHPYLDAEHDAITLGGNGIPLTLLIDGQGLELGRKFGPAKWDDTTVVELIRGLLPGQAQRRTRQP